jgi:hypothetical protein
MSFDLPHTVAAAPAAAAGDVCQLSSQQQLQPQTDSQMTAPREGAPAAGAGARRGSITPGEGLGLLLAGEPDLEDTTTPELEQIGIVPSQEGGSQQQLLLGPAAAAAAGGRGARAPMPRSGGRGGGRGFGPSSGGRGSRGPGVVCEEVTAKQMLFPVFRPLKERKCVILVRHGESSECCKLSDLLPPLAPAAGCVPAV